MLTRQKTHNHHRTVAEDPAEEAKDEGHAGKPTGDHVHDKPACQTPLDDVSANHAKVGRVHSVTPTRPAAVSVKVGLGERAESRRQLCIEYAGGGLLLTG